MVEMITKDEFREQVEQYCKEHEDAIIKHMMNVMGYTDMETLQNDESRMKWGFDCGWILVTPKNAKMRELWGLDYPSTIMPVAYNSQSLNLQQPQVDYILKELGWEEDFTTCQHLD